MSIILGLLSLVISIGIPVLIAVTLHFQVIHFCLFFILPVGAIAVGYVCGFGLFKGLHLSQKKIKGVHFLVGIIMAVICLFSIKYATYSLSYFDDQTQEIVYTTQGDHISNYEIEGYGQLTFINYNKYLIENTPISFSYRTRDIADVSNPVVGWVTFLIDCIGLLIGCIYAGLSIKGKYIYCNTCKKYKKSKTIFTIPKSSGEAFFKELESVLNNINSDTLLKDMVNKYTELENDVNGYYECGLVYCESCKTASLTFKLYERNKKNKIENNRNFNYDIDIRYELTRDFIQQPA